MPNVFLGPEGRETSFPHIRYIGSPPAWPVSTKKQIEKARMSDGSNRYAFFGTLKVFQVGLGFLSKAELDDLKASNELNQILRYKNEHEEDTWYNVVIIAFSHDPEKTNIRQLERYKVSMTLEETDSSLRA